MTKLSPTLIAVLRQRRTSEISDLIELISPIVLKPEFTSTFKVREGFLSGVTHANFFGW
jgi:hypothetical protein